MPDGGTRLGRVLINASTGRMSAFGANRTRRDGGNDANDPEATYLKLKSRTATALCYPFRREAREPQVVKRRLFITLLSGTAVSWALAARAQQDSPVRRIGVLMAHAEGDPEFQNYL